MEDFILSPPPMWISKHRKWGQAQVGFFYLQTQGSPPSLQKNSTYKGKS